MSRVRQYAARPDGTGYRIGPWHAWLVEPPRVTEPKADPK